MHQNTTRNLKLKQPTPLKEIKWTTTTITLRENKVFRESQQCKLKQKPPQFLEKTKWTQTKKK